MYVEATTRFQNLCDILGVDAIPGALNGLGEQAKPHDIITLPEVEVDSRDMTEEVCAHCDLCCDDDPIATPPNATDLTDWISALMTGDLSIAYALAPRIFTDDASQAVCDRALQIASMRTAA